MDTGFIATAIKRIARKKLSSSLFFMAAILISASCFLGFVWLNELRDAAFYLSVIAGGLIVCWLFIRNVVILSRAIHIPLESFFLSDLKRYGPLQNTVEQIDAEASLYVGQIGSFVTQHWIVSAQPTSLGLIRLEDVAWIYKKLVENKMSFFFLTFSSGKTYAAQIWSRFGYCLTIPSTEKGVNWLLEAVSKNVPWVTQGYMEVLAAAWESNRADFIATVDRRRQQTLGSAEEVNEESDDFKPNENGGFLRTGAEPLQNSVIHPPQYGLNDPLIRAGIETYKRNQDRNKRVIGFVTFFFGLVFSTLFILLPISGVLEHTKQISISSEGILVSIALLILGLCYGVFGSKGQGFFEKIIGKSLWGFVLLTILICIGVILLNFGLEYLLGSLGYKVVNPFAP